MMDLFFSAVITPDGRTVASAGSDFTIKLWALNPINKTDSLVDKIGRWLFKKQKSIKTLKLTEQPINLDITPDGRRVIFTTEFGPLAIWPVRQKKDKPINYLQSIHFVVSENGNSLLALDFESNVFIEYSIKDGKLLKKTEIPNSVNIRPGLAELNWAALSKNGKRAVASFGDVSAPSMVVLDTEEGKELNRFFTSS